MKTPCPEILVCLGVVTFLSSCLALKKESVVVTGSNIPTEFRANAWTTFSHQGEEAADAGMCTYVLFGRKVDKESAPDIYNLYKALLNEIADTTYRIDPSDPQDVSKFNIFYIPTKPQSNPDRALIDQYNYSLSQNYLTKLAAVIKSGNAGAKLQSKSGPFLITTLKPLPRISGENYILYADLSDVHPGTASEIVRAYKKRVLTRRIAEDEAFGPISISVLSGLLKAQDDVKIAKISVLSWIHLGEKKKQKR